jgi:hypothetical protein
MISTREQIFVAATGLAKRMKGPGIFDGDNSTLRTRVAAVQKIAFDPGCYITLSSGA